MAGITSQVVKQGPYRPLHGLWLCLAGMELDVHHKANPTLTLILQQNKHQQTAEILSLKNIDIPSSPLGTALCKSRNFKEGLSDASGSPLTSGHLSVPAMVANCLSLRVLLLV